MDVSLSEEQVMLQNSAREFLATECTMESVRRAMAEPGSPSGPLWKHMSELGWLGLTLPEAYGGSEMDLLSLSIVCQESGRVLMPDPYLSTVALGGFAIDRFGGDAQKKRHLPGIGDGSVRVALAQLEDGLSWGPDGIAMAAEKTETGFRFSGTKHFVSDALSADLLLVPVRSGGSGPDGISLLLVETAAPGVSIEAVAYTDQTRKIGLVTFDRVEVAADAVVGVEGEGWSALESTLDFAKVALCGEMLGGAERVLEMSVEYAKSREQFGKPIGSFQAIQHKCSNQFIQVESMRSAVYYAAWSVANGEPDAHLSACLAKAFCGEAYASVAGEGIQIHGGLGFTWEQDLHLYYKRAKASQLLFGDGSWNREIAASLLLD